MDRGHGGHNNPNALIYGGTRPRNLQIRSLLPYPLGPAGFSDRGPSSPSTPGVTRGCIEQKNNSNAQRTSSATDPRHRSKRPRTERAHIPTITTPAERARQAVLHGDPHQAADRTSYSSAASLPGSATGALPGGQHATDTRPRGSAADQRPEQGVGGHPSPSVTTLDQDWETMPPPPSRPPQRRNTDPFDDPELGAVYGIHTTTPSSGLVAALWEHLHNVNPKRLFAMVPLLHPATTDIFVRQLEALIALGRRLRTTLLTRGSGGSTRTNRTREACGSHTWAGRTRS